jgi:hypothetical protein
MAIDACESTGESFGDQRLWTSAAWGCFALVAGAALDLWGFQVCRIRGREGGIGGGGGGGGGRVLPGWVWLD